MIRIITSLVAIFTVASVQSQTLKEPPKIVIGITIDQLRGDYLELFQHTFGERGFKRLFAEGTVYQNINFDYPNLNSASAIATIYTGATPFYHGIINDKKYFSSKGLTINTYNDDAFLGNYTSEKLSPNALRVSTITDELKIASQGSSDVYSFAPNSYESMSAAGHAANCAFWIENSSGKWATSTYFKDFHWTVDQENRNNIYSNQIGNIAWTPAIATNNYKAFPYTTNNVTFQHTFGVNSESFTLLKKSPFVNENIRLTAQKLIEKAELGKKLYPDFLSLTFYAGNYPKSIDKNYSLEIQDLYKRLDTELATLFDYIEKTVGLKNALIFVSSTGYYKADDVYSSNISMPNGTFYSNRCEALLNMYLMAIYGKEQWVDKFYDGQIYLNRRLIESKNLSLAEVQSKAADFVSQFTGVQDVATAHQILGGTANSNMQRYKDIFSKDNAGDIFIEIQPGYNITDEQTSSSNDNKRVREQAVNCPVFFFGYNSKPERIRRTIKATEIAPTVSYILRIRSPNASRGEVLPEFLQF